MILGPTPTPLCRYKTFVVAISSPQNYKECGCTHSLFCKTLLKRFIVILYKNGFLVKNFCNIHAVRI